MSASIWPKTSSHFVARLLSAHGALGLALGALLYILCVSGSLMVFHGEFEHWENASAPVINTITPDQVQRAGEAAFAQAEEKPHHLLFALPEAHKPLLTVSNEETTWFVDPDGNLTAEVNHGWSDFLLNLHYYFHLPSTLGLVITGLLGAMMLGLILSGFLSHPKIFRDAFAFRVRTGGRLTLTDLHNRLSVWGAPFHIAIALTGALLGLATIVALSVAMMFYGGDTSKVFAPIFGGAHPIDETPSDIANIAGALEHFQSHYTEADPWYLVVHDPATVGQSIDIRARHANRLILDEVYQYEGDGQFHGTKGYVDGEIGKQVAMSVYSVHFGNYGGLPVKLAYLALGLALSIVSAGGIDIWLKKRQEKGRPMPELERAWMGVVWGTPLALSAMIVVEQFAFMAGQALAGPFWGLLLALIVITTLIPASPVMSRVWRSLTGLLLLFASLMHTIQAGAQGPATSVLSGAIALSGLAFLVSVFLYKGRAQSPA